MRYQLLLLLILSIVPHTRSHAQTQDDMFDEDWRWVRFGTESGLPSNHIYNLTETSDGTVWVATTGGLAYYDGYVWKSVTISSMLAPGRLTTFDPMPGNKILATMDDHCFIGDKSGFDLLDSMRVQESAPFGTNGILLVSDYQLYTYIDGKIQPATGALSVPGIVRDVWQTTSGTNWIATGLAIYKWEEGTWVCKLRSSKLGLKLGNRVLLENSRGSAIASIDQPLDMWGLWELSGKANPSKLSYTNRSSIRSASLSQDDEVWVVHESNISRVRVNGTWSTVRLSRKRFQDIEFVRHRKNGDLWFGTQQGLFLYRRSSPRWSTIPNRSNEVGISVNEIIMTKDSSLWMATSYGLEIRPAHGVEKSVSSINGQLLYMVTGLVEDERGHIWISSGGSFEGAYEWDGANWKWYGDNTALARKRIHKIIKDKSDQIWFLSIWSEPPNDTAISLGADVFKDGQFVKHWGKEQGISIPQIYSVAWGRDGTIWFGTVSGLSRCKNGTLTHWGFESPSFLRRVFAIAVDSSDRVWFGDRISGLCYIDENDSLCRITTEDGLINNEIWDLKIDKADRLWISTGGGLSCYDHGAWTSFDSRLGLVDAELWPILLIGNKVYVGSRGGLSILNLSETHQPNPIVIIERPATRGNTAFLRWKPFAYWGASEGENILTRYRINEEPWSKWGSTYRATVENLDAGTYTLQVQAMGMFSRLNDQSETAVFTIEKKFYNDPVFLVPGGALVIITLLIGIFAAVRKKRQDAEVRASEAKFRTITETTSSAIFIYNDKNVLFSNPSAELLAGYSNDEYSAMGISDIIHPDYVKIFNERSLAFNATKDGPSHIELKIRSKRHEERWVDYMEGRIEFHGQPAVVGTASDITERKLAEEKNIANQLQLRSLASKLASGEERERRRMAAFLHESIGQTLALCKIKVGTLEHSTHQPEVAGSLKEIRGFLDQAILNTRSLTSELSPPILYELGLYAAIEWVAEQIQEQSTIKFVCVDDGASKPLSEELSTFLFHAVRELLVNTVKHSQAKNATINLQRDGNNVRIIVHDDGVGSSPDTTRARRHRSDGFGLFNIRERIDHFGGSMSITSAAGGGMTVILSAPLEVSLMEN